MGSSSVSSVTGRMWIVLVVLASGCGSFSATGSTTGVSGTEAVVAETTVPTSIQPAKAGSDAVFVSCEDVAVLSATLIGTMSGHANPDPIVTGAIQSYGLEHRDTFAGLWIDRDHGGTLVAAFTDNPAGHLEAILARRPSLDDEPAETPRPPITDDRPLGEQDVAIDVVQATFSEVELLATLEDFDVVRNDGRFQVGGSWLDITINRAALEIIDPTPEQLADLAMILPVDRVCLDIASTTEPPAADLSEVSFGLDDPQVTCGGASFPLSVWEARTPVESLDHPAVEVFLAEKAGSVELPKGGAWYVLIADETAATFVQHHGAHDIVGLSLRTSGWELDGLGGCRELVLTLPEGLGRVEWAFDNDFPAPGPNDTIIHLLATERACASGAAMGDRLLDPQVIETDGLVLVGFAAIPQPGVQDCQGNPPATVTIELSAPLGDRVIRDAMKVASGDE